FESAVSSKAYASIVVNEREREALSRLAPHARLEVVQVGVDLIHLAPPERPLPSMDVVFCGVMNYRPNEEGVLWFATRVWPLVKRQHSNARLRIVGSDPTKKVIGIADLDKGIEVTGAVPDVRPYLWSSAVSVAPLLTARGVQMKVLEAVGAGLPAVITSAVAH